MRSASCGVVIEPSTSDTSYGPLATAREASGKFAISTAPAIASSPRSQSSSASWQPSHEANFHTASFGLRLRITSYLPRGQQPLDTVQPKYRTVLAHELRTALAVAAQSDAALHVPLQRYVDVIGGNATLLELHRREPHHHLGPADHCDRPEPV